MPFPTKDKISKYFDESLEIFERRGQAIWNAHKEKALKPKQVKYDIDYISMSKMISLNKLL